jgi:hypothetical protein
MSKRKPTKTKGRMTLKGRTKARVLKARLDEFIGPSIAVQDVPNEEGASGRPRKTIDLRILAGLAAVQCTVDEMAAVLGCSCNLILLNEEYMKLIAKERLASNMSLRRAAFTSALNGNVSMQIFLLKAYCGVNPVASDNGSTPTPGEGADLPIVVINRTIGDLPTSEGVRMVMGDAS